MQQECAVDLADGAVVELKPQAVRLERSNAGYAQHGPDATAEARSEPAAPVPAPRASCPRVRLDASAPTRAPAAAPVLGASRPEPQVTRVRSGRCTHRIGRESAAAGDP